MGIEKLNEFWPDWEIVEQIGEGSFGKVYKAVNNSAGFPAYSAIKVLSVPANAAELEALYAEGLSESDSISYFKGIVDDFLNEIKLMHALKGAPNIVNVEAFKILESSDECRWDIFIRMELLTSFRSYANSNKLTEADVVKLGIDIATGLDICSKKHIIHRDIKPANIFVDEYGNFKLGDFGIAKELAKTKSAVSAKGTFHYMAPEVPRGNSYDHTVDIYSLGLVMYTLLNNNRPPFISPDCNNFNYSERQKANEKRMSGDPIPPLKTIDPRLSQIVLKACSYEPSKRFRSAAEFKAALQSLLNSETPSASSASALSTDNKNDKNAIKQSRKNSKLIVALIVLAAILGISCIILLPMLIESTKPEVDTQNHSQTEALDISSEDSTQQIEPDSTSVLSSDNDNTEKAETIPESDETEDMPQSEDPMDTPEPSVYNIGDRITLGSYEQDNNLTNGTEAVEWIVIDNRDNCYLLISRFALDSEPYNFSAAEVTWGDSTLRSYLNSQFYNTVFSDEEKSMIIETETITPDDNYESILDKVFILSAQEANSYIDVLETLKVTPTTYAVASGVYTENSYCGWWLRGSGDNSDTAKRVNVAGEILSSASSEGGVERIDYAVRPAIWINMDP